MFYYEVIVEHASLDLNQAFTYQYENILEPGVRVKVPFGRQTITGLVVKRLDAKPDVEFAIKSIKEVLDPQPLLTKELFALAEYLSYETISSLMSVYKTILPAAYSPSSTAKARAKEDWIVPLDPDHIPEAVKLTPKQKEVLANITHPMPAAKARKENSPGIIKTLLEKQALKIESRDKGFVLVEKDGSEAWPTLTRQQQAALDKIRASDKSTILLHGATGSGKTEVLFHLAKEALDHNQQVLYLVPEIGLTPMMIERIARRFDVPVIPYHSRLSASEAADMYARVLEMKAGIVIGTRSAVFLPFENLGLIIMDEEHDTSYKQDKMPKYHTRDAASFRAAWHHCKLVLASATPCLESYARAYKKVYELVEMPDRAAGSFPAIQLVDLCVERSYEGIGTTLIQKIQDRLDKKEKVILLLNRRGYIPIAKCTKCGQALLCEDCGIPLSYHKSENALVCHICSRRYPMQSECPNCRAHSWSELGAGTQKIEEKLAELFPKANIVRMDADSTRMKYGHQKVLQEFETSGDILLGTQMIAKGLDFESVTLTGIINADMSLNRPDYRASELTYQMLEQASGRSGRGKLPGEVVIQTYNPRHYVLQYIVRHDYRGFFEREMQYRHIGMYPPFSFMATIIFHHENINTAMQAAEMARDFLEQEHALVLGPREITMRKKICRARLLIKAKDRAGLASLLWKYAGWHKNHLRSLKYEINMDVMLLED